jgi:hypothetical protein
VWFLGQDRWIALLTLTLAIASKHLIRRGGRHLFNPSGFGIAITGALCMLAPDTFGFFDLSHGFNAGPNMVELILILALIAQLRVPIVLVSIGGFIALLLLVDTQILTRPTALWGPVFLALCLLVTDPATIPKTPVGKLLFGAVYGSLMAVMATGLTAMGENDFFSKVFPLPLVNALVPRFDQWGSRAALRRRWAASSTTALIRPWRPGSPWTLRATPRARTTRPTVRRLAWPPSSPCGQAHPPHLPKRTAPATSP